MAVDKSYNKPLGFIALELKALDFNECLMNQHSSPYLYIKPSSKLGLITVKRNYYFGQSILPEVVYSQLTVQVVGKKIFSKLKVLRR